MSVDLSQEYFAIKQRPVLHRRAIVPDADLLRHLHKNKRSGAKTIAEGKVDLYNVQGDIYPTFSKKWERFLFFKIVDLVQFKKHLYSFVPRITSSAQSAVNISQISASKQFAQELELDTVDISKLKELAGELNIDWDSDIAPILQSEDLRKEYVKKLDRASEKVSHGIAFSRAGLRKMGVIQALQDVHFDQGSMVNEKAKLGDMACYNRLFKTADNTHGVILVTTKFQDTCKTKMNEVIGLFNKSIEVLANWDGRIRSGDAEHFGWRDGIAQPALKDIGKPIPGQRVVNPGVLVLGYPGDPVYDNVDLPARPAFTKDGSFMVFRKLEQNVLYFEDYINKNWITIPKVIEGITLTDAQRKALYGARMFGRFKSGVPLALSPYIEDRKYLAPEKINDFDYTNASNGCPFSAHIRKTEPRNLQPIVRKEYLDASVIVRSGIPYGPEISADEREIWKTLSDSEKYNAKCNRGLLFVCYQSSLDNGFYRQTTGFANNDFFPITDVLPKKIGQDPIIGGPPPTYEVKPTGATGIPTDKVGKQLTFNVLNQGQDYEVVGVAEKPPTLDQKFFATSRGGEYYFVPSISTVKSWGTAPQSQ